MTLRTRVAVLVGIIAASAMLVGGFWSYAAVSEEQYAAVDQFLERRREAPEQVERISNLPPDASPFDDVRLPVDDGVTFQVNAADGTLLFASNPDIELDLPVASELGTLRTVHVGGDRFRIRADTTADGDIVQVARSLAEADATVEAIRNRLWLLGIVVSVVAAALGWLLAGWMSRPLERLTGVVDHVARTSDLSVEHATTVNSDSRFEVDRLAVSFASMLGALRRSSEQQQQLVADAGHEMRTPLTTVRTNVELLQSGRLTDDDRAHSLAAIVREVDELAKLTDELVELSAVDGSGESAQTVDLLEVVTTAAERAHLRHGRQVDVTGTASQIEGRPTALDRAVTNLIDNAVKFSPPDTPIVVIVGTHRVAVRDYGVGIDEADRGRVFERFHRSEAARTLPGSGLGLAIVAKVAADHDGAPFVADPCDGDGVIVGFTVGD